MSVFVNMPLSDSELVNTGRGSGLPVKFRSELVLTSITRMRDAIRMWREIEAMPSSSTEQRDEARSRMAYTQREFGGQWENVEAILTDQKVQSALRGE